MHALTGPVAEGRIPMERRACPRVNVLAEYSGMMLVDVPDLGTAGLLIDASEDGLGLAFAVPVPELNTLKVEFRVGDRVLRSICDSIWTTPTARGLRFRELSQQDREEFRTWLRGFPSSNLIRRTDATFESSSATSLPPEASSGQVGPIDGLYAADKPRDQGVPRQIDALEDMTGNMRVATGSTNGDARLPGAVPPGPAGMPSAEKPARQTKPDWVVRLATSRERQLAESLKVWRQELKTAYEVSGAAGHPRPTSIRDDSAREKRAAMDAVAGRGRSLRQDGDEISVALRAELSAQAHREIRPSAFWWVFLVIVAAFAGIYAWHFQMSRKAATLAVDPERSAIGKHSIEESIRSERQPAGTIVEIAEGPAVRHSPQRSKRPQTITPGRAIVQDMPQYDNLALASGAHGDVHAVLTINDRGVVQDVQIIDGSQILARQVTAAATHWRYTPFSDESGPVSVELPVVFKFHLFVRGEAKQGRGVLK